MTSQTTRHGSNTTKGKHFKHFKPTFEVKLHDEMNLVDLDSPSKNFAISRHQNPSKGDDEDSDMDDVGIEHPIPKFQIPNKGKLKRTPP